MKGDNRDNRQFFFSSRLGISSDIKTGTIWVWHNGYGTKLNKGMVIRELQAAGLDPLLKWWLTHTQLCAEACQNWYFFYILQCIYIHKHCHSLWQIFTFDLLSLIPLSLKTGLLFPPICQNREKHNLESEGLSWDDCIEGWDKPWTMTSHWWVHWCQIWGFLSDISIQSLVGEYPHDWKGWFYPHASLGWYQYFYCRSISHDWLVIFPLSLDVSMVCVTD